jgi:proline racemase
VIPEITGRAHLTGLNQLVLRPDDPFPAGFVL